MLKPISFSAPIQKEYEESLSTDKIQLMQVSSLSGIAVFIFSMFIDAWALPSVQQEVFTLRLLVSISLLACFTSALFKDFFLKHYTNIIIATFVLIAFPVEYAIHISQSSELAYYSYFAVLVAIIMVLYSWTHLSTPYLILCTSIIIGGYILAVVTRIDQGPHGVAALLIVTLAILTGAVFIAFIGKLIRDKHLHEKFLLQQSFKSLFEEKALEADTHKHHASHDSLTNLPNRRYVENTLITRLTEIQKQNKLMVVIFIDLNGFKGVNDDFGHDAGDHVLKTTASRLRNSINEKDSLIRLGGDEFLICAVIENDNNEKDIIDNIQIRIKETINQAIIFEGDKLLVSASIGVARSDQDGNEINTLIAVADKRMYQDKGCSRESKESASNVTAFPLQSKKIG